MNQIDRLIEIVSTYRKHQWMLRRILLTPESLALWTLEPQDTEFIDIDPYPATIDAVWFSRPSHNAREAWEIRLVGETPYALFETFEAEEDEAEREEVRLEMEAKMRDYAGK